MLWLSRTRLLEVKLGVSYNGNRPRHRRLKFRTAQRILGISPEDIPLAGGAIVPAADTWRLINELLASGVTKAAIARALGNKRSALQISRGCVVKRTADRIAAFYEEALGK